MKSEKEKDRKKGFLAAIWESMTKTGGCCGPGENCCGSTQPVAEKKHTGEEQSVRMPDETEKRRS